MSRPRTQSQRSDSDRDRSDRDEEHAFEQFDISYSLLRAVIAAGYDEPRPIQVATIPEALEGRDILGLAQTGTGKTAAFALPILERLLRHRGRGPRVLVVGPTRELVTQIDSEFQKLAARTRIKTMTIYGGISDKPQIQRLRQRPDIICACPGRFLDLYGQGAIDLSNVEAFVLDEADHMFDMGFLPDIRRIIKALPRDRQNLLFAATMPDEIRHLAEGLLTDPFRAEIDHTAPASTIEHALYPVLETRKSEMLKYLLSREDFKSAIVFMRTKHRAKRLAQQLDRLGHRAIALQGNMSQNQRDKAMSGFREGYYDVLVATDIVARGIDVSQVSHVINFDVPNTPEAYTHRIGRTGRSERSGKAYTFVTEDDGQVINAIERRIGDRIDICTVPGFEDGVAPSRTGGARKKSSRRGASEGRRRKPAGSGTGSSSDSKRRRRRRRQGENNTVVHGESGSSRRPSGGAEGGQGRKRRRRQRRPGR